MSPKAQMKKKVTETTEKVTQVFAQAKESLKVLETLEKEAVAKARTFVKLPSAEQRKRLTNDRILGSLKKLGVLTRSDLETLEARVAKLEADLTAIATAPRRTKSSTAAKETATTDTTPRA